MSDIIFPTPSGIAWDVTKTPEFFSLSKVSPSGVDISAGLAAYPRWHFSLAYEYLRDGDIDSDLQQLMGFFMARHGNVDDWLYLDPADHIVEQQVFATGTGSRVSFPLCHNIGGFVEPIAMSVPGTEKIYRDGVLVTSGYTISNGIVIFDTAPGVSVELSWSGQFYYRCRFKESSMEFKNFAWKLWEARTVEFVSGKRLDV